MAFSTSSPFDPNLPTVPNLVEVSCADRWQAYFRLRELGIDCECCGHQPLQVCVATPQSAVQLWSVLNQLSKSRLELADWLQRCWELPARDR